MLRTALLLAFTGLSVNVGLAAAGSPVGPKTYLPENWYAFEPVLEKTLIVHDFLIREKRFDIVIWSNYHVL